MLTPPVKIDFLVLGKALQLFVREKAKKANSTIIYKFGNQVIEEDPNTSSRKILKDYSK